MSIADAATLACHRALPRVTHTTLNMRAAHEPANKHKQQRKNGRNRKGMGTQHAVTRSLRPHLLLLLLVRDDLRQFLDFTEPLPLCRGQHAHAETAKAETQVSALVAPEHARDPSAARRGQATQQR